MRGSNIVYSYLKLCAGIEHTFCKGEGAKVKGSGFGVVVCLGLGVRGGRKQTSTVGTHVTI